MNYLLASASCRSAAVSHAVSMCNQEAPDPDTENRAIIWNINNAGKAEREIQDNREERIQGMVWQMDCISDGNLVGIS